MRLSSGSSPNSTKSSTNAYASVLVDLVVDPCVRPARRRRPSRSREAVIASSAASRSVTAIAPATPGSSFSSSRALTQSPRALAEPGLDVALVVEVLDRVEQLAELRLRVRRAQDLAGGVERIRAQLALRAHGRLHVEERVTRHGARRVGARCASAATAGSQEQGKSGEERCESKHGSFRFGHDAACLPRGPTQGVAYPDTPQLSVQIARMQRGLRSGRTIGALARPQEIPGNRHVLGPQADAIQVAWDERR